MMNDAAMGERKVRAAVQRQRPIRKSGKQIGISAMSGTPQIGQIPVILAMGHCHNALCTERGLR